jgi:hypothetical protein
MTEFLCLSQPGKETYVSKDQVGIEELTILMEVAPTYLIMIIGTRRLVEMIAFNRKDIKSGSVADSSDIRMHPLRLECHSVVDESRFLALTESFSWGIAIISFYFFIDNIFIKANSIRDSYCVGIDYTMSLFIYVHDLAPLVPLHSSLFKLYLLEYFRKPTKLETVLLCSLNYTTSAIAIVYVIPMMLGLLWMMIPLVILLALSAISHALLITTMNRFGLQNTFVFTLLCCRMPAGRLTTTTLSLAILNFWTTAAIVLCFYSYTCVKWLDVKMFYRTFDKQCLFGFGLPNFREHRATSTLTSGFIGNTITVFMFILGIPRYGSTDNIKNRLFSEISREIEEERSLSILPETSASLDTQSFAILSLIRFSYRDMSNVLGRLIISEELESEMNERLIQQSSQVESESFVNR